MMKVRHLLIFFWLFVSVTVNAQVQYGGQIRQAFVTPATVMQNAAAVTGNGTSLVVTGYGTAVLQIGGVFVGSIAFETFNDLAATWIPISATQVGAGDIFTVATVPGVYRITVAGLDLIRARVTWTSGTSITINGRATNAVNASKIIKLATSGLNIGKVFLTDGTNSVGVTAAGIAGSELTVDRLKVNASLRMLDVAQTAGSQLVAAKGDQTTGLWVNVKNTVVPVSGNFVPINTASSGTLSASDAVVGAPDGIGTILSGASTSGSIVSIPIPDGFQSWTLMIKGFVSGFIYTEASMNSTNGTDGDWIDIKGRKTGTAVGVESVTYAQSASGVYRGNPAGFKYMRARLIGGTGATINWSLSNGTGAVFLNSGIPTGGSIIGKVGIDQTTPGTTNLVSTGLSQPLTDAQLRTTPVPVSGSFFQATQPVSGTFFQTTQPVSIATMPSTPVTGTFFQATQPVSLATNTPTLQSGSTTAVTQATAANLNATVTQQTLTKGTQGAAGVTTQDLKDAGRNQVHYYMLIPVLTSATDGLQSLTGTKGGATVAATTTPAVVTTGKILRITRLAATYISTAASGYGVVRLRFNTAGVVAITSPIAATLAVGNGAPVTVNATDSEEASLSEGWEFAAATGIGVSVQGFAAATATAVGYVLVSVTGYEY